MGNRNGLTLIEILTTLIIISVFTTIALDSMGNVVDGSRYDKTVRQMQQIRAALVGETQRLETGLRKNYGYLGDVGVLPTTSQGIAAIFSIPTGVSAWAVNSSYSVATGWRGPYLTNTTDIDYTTDAWGNAIVYSYSAGVATLTSYGKDGVAGGTGYNQDIVIQIPAAVINGKVLGYIAKGNSGIATDAVPYSANTADVVIYYPDGAGGVASKTNTVPIASSGAFTFSSIPLGFAAVKVFIPNASTYTSVLGPAIVEINKATAAAVPVDTGGTLFSVTTNSQCANASTASIVASSWVVSSAARIVHFQLSFPAAYTWSQFYQIEENGATLYNFQIDSASAYRLNGAFVNSAGTGNIAVETYYTISSAGWAGIPISAGTHSFHMSYNATNWSATHSLYMYQMGCQLLRVGPGI